MSLYAYNLSINFESITPGCCGVPFMMSEQHYNIRQKDRKNWYCPSCGRSRYFINETNEDQLKRQLKSERDTNSFLRKQNEQERNRTRAQKAAKTRIKNRIKNGVCPCCNRTFKQLAAHMKNKHPDYMERNK